MQGHSRTTVITYTGGRSMCMFKMDKNVIKLTVLMEKGGNRMKVWNI
jgi:hypothetical protein